MYAQESSTNNNVICPICKEEINNNYLKTYFSDLVKQEYKLYHCKSCHLEFWIPLKVTLKFYEEATPADFFYRSLLPGYIELPHHTLPFFKHFPYKYRKGFLLDVGCGNGMFLKHAQEKGFRVYGIDFDKKLIKVIQSVIGIKNVFAMSLEKFRDFAKVKNLEFDIISFFEVLEHQDKPSEFIEDIKSLLKLNSWIVGSVPLRERFLSEWDRKGSISDFPPHHFTWWSKDVLIQFLKRHGFSNIDLYPAKYKLHEVSSWWESKLFGILTKQLKRTIKEKIVSTNNIESIDDFLNKISEAQEDYKFKYYLLKIASFLKNMPFAPFSLLTINKFNKFGMSMYFQAQLINKPHV
jgi:2-polyprenyl-3-methyl-5-hydroxy-6-metoxy-1,4-benzoquinol methylase